MENLASLNLWMYLQKRYGVTVQYSDTGWQIDYKGQTFKDGDVAVGHARYRLGVRNDRKQININKLRIIENIHGLLPQFIHDDAVLRQKLGTMRVEARRASRG